MKPISYNIPRNKDCVPFYTDAEGITKLKIEFLQGAKSYLYLRKGEAFGEIALMLQEAINQGPDQLMLLLNSVESSVNHTISSLEALDPKELYIWYKLLSKGAELSAKAFSNILKVFKPKKSMAMNIDIKILCNPQIEKGESVEWWENLGHNKKYYNESLLASDYRIFLNDERYATFFRRPNSMFVGHIGKDKKTKHELEQMFLEQWNNPEFSNFPKE